MRVVNTPEAARRLARTIVSDIALYNRAKVREGIMNDNLFEILKEELEEGRRFYMNQVSPEILEKTNFFEEAIVDVMIKQCGNIRSNIW
ncbi:MAG: hypothetical protein QW561_01445 [Candidatus Aenigmatarchaeota archaeon]